MQTRCHLSVLIHEQAKKYGAREAVIFRLFGSKEWRSISWNQFSFRVKQVSNALLNLGLKPQDKVGIFSQNCVQYLYTDFGSFGVRVVTVPFYATSSEQQIQYMIQDAGIRVLFVGEQEQYDKAQRILPLCPTLERIIVFDPSVHIGTQDSYALLFEDFLKWGENFPRQTEVEELYKQANEEDICNILYTSGTTGDSKGVVLSYSQYAAALKANDECVDISDKDRVINFLPFTHIFERGWAFLSLSEGATLIVNTYPHEIQESMRQTHPTSMSAVPRFWEKVYAGVLDRIAHSSPIQQRIFHYAWRIGKKYNIEYLSRGKRPPLALKMQYAMVNKGVFRMIREQLGLDNPNIFPTAGSTVSPEVEEFVHSIGICMIVGYGLTESLATVSCDRKNEPYTIGSVGRPINGLDIKISDEGEILLKGPTITRGYYHREALNAMAFDKDGYFHTGDAGYLKNGELFLTERIKDLFKTSNGKYIAPQALESKILVDKYVDQIAVIADQRKFVSALIVPDFKVLEEYAKSRGISFDSPEDLCTNEEVKQMLKDRIDTIQQQMADYEKIKRFTLLAHPFSIESGELTNTLKMKRQVISKNYQDVIDRMYEN